MTPKEFKQHLITRQQAMADLANKILPVKVGNIAVNHFKENFNRGGFVNDGLHPWTPSKRIGRSESAADNYGTLLSSSPHLRDMTTYIPKIARVTISNTTPYAAIHNNGGTIPITPKMRSRNWALYFNGAGITKGMSSAEKKKKIELATEETNKWKKMALTKKNTITMPRRQFIGLSKELNDKIIVKINKEVDAVMKLYSK